MWEELSVLVNMLNPTLARDMWATRFLDHIPAMLVKGLI